VQAHASDLRAEVEKDWGSIMNEAAERKPTAAEADPFVHQAVRDWRGCRLSPAVLALLEYAEKVTRGPATCVAADIGALRQSGWSDAAILDAVQVTTYFNYINRIADALGVEPEADLPHWGEADAVSGATGR
jgi:uncharacterized peroxidase-related enzyme